MPGFRGQVVAIDPGDENGPVLEIRPHGKSKSDPTNVRSARPAWVARK